MELQIGGLYESKLGEIFLRVPGMINYSCWRLGEKGSKFVVLEKLGVGKQDWVWWFCYNHSIHYSVLTVASGQVVKMTLTINNDTKNFQLLCAKNEGEL